MARFVESLDQVPPTPARRANGFGGMIGSATARLAGYRVAR
jgi:hypothetical protein